MGIPERKEREKEQRRNDIIDAAERIFFTKGVEHSTMDDVATEAELSKGTLYLYFKSKEDIQFAIFMRGAEIMENMMRYRIASKKTGYEKLLELAQTTVEYAALHKNYFEFFMIFQSSKLNELKIAKAQVEKYLREQSPLAIVDECVAQGVKDGSLRKDIPVEIFTATLWTQLLGLLIVMNKKADVYEMFDIDPGDVLKTHLELVSNGALEKK